MSFLRRIRIDGYKSIAHLCLECASRNLILGPNGSGKSSLIEVFDLVRQVLQASAERFYLRGSDFRFHHHGPKRTPTIGIHLEWDDFSYSLRFLAESGRTYLDAQRLHCQERGVGWDRGGLPPWGDWPLDVVQQIQPVLQSLENLVAPHHFHDTSNTAALRRPCAVDDNRRLRGDGSNLAAYLYWMARQEANHYMRVVDTVRQVAPWFQDFVLEPQRDEPSQIKLEWRHRDSDNYFDGFSLSDGSLRFICLCTLLLQPSPPPLLLLDEPELGLHPAALYLLGDMLTAVDSQIFVTTQSAALVDHFGPEEVIVSDYVGQAAHLTRLDPTKLLDWLDRYSLSELWEKNLLGGRP